MCYINLCYTCQKVVVYIDFSLPRIAWNEVIWFGFTCMFNKLKKERKEYIHCCFIHVLANQTKIQNRCLRMLLLNWIVCYCLFQAWSRSHETTRLWWYVYVRGHSWESKVQRKSATGSLLVYLADKNVWTRLVWVEKELLRYKNVLSSRLLYDC